MFNLRLSWIPHITKTIKAILCFLIAVTGWLPMSGMQATAGSLTLKFYDDSGAALTFAQVQALQKGPLPHAYEADALIDPVTLRVLATTPMTSAGSFTFPLPTGVPAAFAINWPTRSQGYGLVIVDNGGAGFATNATVNFTEQAAKNIRRRLEAALAARPDYTRSGAFNSAYGTATNHLNLAAASADESVKGAQGQMALDQLVVAYDVLLADYGPDYARAHQGTTPSRLGFTMEDVSRYESDLDKLAAMAGPYAWVRLVFQPGESPAAYRAAVSYAKAKGIKIMGLPVDSSADKRYTRAQYLERYKDFIAAFPAIDCWEVGNEVNGGWSSPDIAARVADVAAYCKSQNKETYLTLFWQLNTADARFALFNWIDANLPGPVRSNLDCIGLSQYQEQAPVGAAFDPVMQRLRKEFPNSQTGLGELGYWIKGQRHWWAYSTNFLAAKDIVLEHYYKAALGYAGANGGGFWWNFASGGPDHDFDSAMTNSITALKNRLGAPPVGQP